MPCPSPADSGLVPTIGQCSRHGHPCPDCAKELRQPYKERLDRIELATFGLVLLFLPPGIFTCFAALTDGPLGENLSWLWLGLPCLALAIYCTIKGGQRYSRVAEELNAAERAAGMKPTQNFDALSFN